MSEQDFTYRIERLWDLLKGKSIDALLVRRPPNLRYLTGWEEGWLLLSPEVARLWVQDLYAARSYPGVLEVSSYEERPEPLLRRFLKERGVKRLGVDDRSVDGTKRLRKRLGVGCRPVRLVEELRAEKSDSELLSLRKSVEVAKSVLERLEEKAWSLLGLSELEVAAELEKELRLRGSETPPFERGAIVASGENSAQVHPYPSAKRIKEGDVLLIDLGARVEGYHSDITRTLCLGNEEAERWLEFVKELQLQLIEGLKEGVKASEVYEKYKLALRERGLRPYHGVGHGIGLEVHEDPNLGPDSEEELKEGMVLTIEPGVYLRGKFGVRVEDVAWLGPKSPRLL